MRTWRIPAVVAAWVVAAGHVFGQTVTTLQNGQVVRGLTAPAGQGLLFKVTVPAGQAQLAVGTDGGTGECDLYLRRGAAPMLSQYDYRPYRTGNREYVAVNNPQAGDWYIMAHARGAFAGMLLGVAFQPGTTAAAATPRVEAPVFSPAAGTFAGPLSVTMSSATAGAAIRYTSDGSDPTASSALYSGPVALAATTTLKAKALKAGMTGSETTGGTFTIASAAPVTTLQNGQVVSGLSATAGEGLLFRVSVPAGQGQLAVGSDGGTGECDLHVRFGAAPTTTQFDVRPYRTGNREYVAIPNPQAGDWYVLLHARSAFANVSLGTAFSAAADPTLPSRAETPVLAPAGGSFAGPVSVTMASATAGATIRFTTDGSEPTAASTVYSAPLTLTATTALRAKAFMSGMDASQTASATFTIAAAAPSPATVLQNGQVVSRLSATAGQGLLFRVAVPAGQSQLAVGSDGGTGECDLYVRSGAAPTTTQYDYRPFRAGNREYVAIPNPQAGDWYILLQARPAFANVSLGTACTAAAAAPAARVATPVFSPAGGTFAGSVNVTISSATSGATIRYTTNGTEPTSASAACAGAIRLTATTALRAKAFKAGMADSYTAAAAYTIAAAGTTTPPATTTGHAVDIDRFSWTPTSAAGASRITGRLVVPARWSYMFIGLSGNYSDDFLLKVNPNSTGVYTVTIPARAKLIAQLPSPIRPDPNSRHCIVLEYSFDPRYASSYRTARVVHYSYNGIYPSMRDWRWQERGSAAPNWRAYLLLP